MAGFSFCVPPREAGTKLIWEGPDHLQGGGRFLSGGPLALYYQPFSATGSTMTLISIPANPVPEDVVTGTIKTPDGAELRFAR